MMPRRGRLCKVLEDLSGHSIRGGSAFRGDSMTTEKMVRAALLFALSASSALGQETRGRVQGTVADSSGAVVPGASVVLSNDNTGIAVTRTSKSDGGYLFDYVDPGSYTVTVTLAGFNTAVQKNVRVQQ